MNETQKPIEQFFHHYDANMDMLYEAVPYVQLNMKKPLAIYIKMQEMMQIMRGFDDSDTLSACGLEEKDHNVEDMLYAMRAKAHGRPANQLDMILNVIQAGKVYHAFQEISRAQSTATSSQDAGTAGTPSSNQESNNNDLLAKILPMLLSNQNNTGSASDMSALIQNIMKGETYESKLAQ